MDYIAIFGQISRKDFYTTKEMYNMIEFNTDLVKLINLSIIVFHRSILILLFQLWFI